MANIKNRALCGILERITPGFVRVTLKKIYWKIKRLYYRYKCIEKGRFVEFGHGFRLTRSHPYRVFIKERTIIEQYNVWDAQLGDITVGKNCWFGVNNVVMGPLEIGDNVSTGPYVKIVGPRHPVLVPEQVIPEKTVIGDNVWIATGAIILFGVKVGNNTVISAGSVVTKDVPKGAFVGGNPARNLSRMVDIAWKRQYNREVGDLRLESDER